MTREATMNRYRTTARVVGVVYLAGFVVGIVGNRLIQSILGAPDHLATVSAHSMMLAIGAMLWLMAVAGDAAHGVLMFPVLKPHSERLAFGYFAARIIDAVFIAVNVLFTPSNTARERVPESSGPQRFLPSSPEHRVRPGESVCLPDRHDRSLGWLV